MKNVLIYKTRYVGMFIFALLLLGACSEDETIFDFKGDEVVRIFLNDGHNTLNSYKAFPFTVVHTPAGSMGDQVMVKFPVRATLPVSEDVKVVLEVDNSLIAAYNQKTEKDYKQLPEGFLELQQAEITIKSGESSSSDSIVAFISQEKYAELTESSYIVPIKIASISNVQNTQISTNLNTVYAIVNTFVTNLYSNPTANDIEGEIIDRTGWEGFVDHDLASGAVANMFNNTNNSFWRVDPGNNPFEWIVDMKSLVPDITGIRMHTNNAAYNLTSVEVFSSSDGENWISQGLTSPPTGNAFQYYRFYAPVEAQYFKFKVLSKLHGTQVRIARFEVYAYSD